MIDSYCYNSFAITALGRSGTKFLSYNMNLSNSWTVLHEPKSETIQERFNKNNYGEVNSYLRWSFADLKVKNKGIIIRNPYEIAISYYNRVITSGKEFTIENCLHLKEGLEILDNLIKNNIFCIRFEKMVSDLDYLNNIIKKFEIKDLNIEKIEKINDTKYFLIKNVNEIPIKSQLSNCVDWFYHKYYFKVIL